MELLKLISALLLGVVIFIFTNFNKSEESKLIKFVLKKENYLAVILNIVAGLILIFSYIDDPTILSIFGIGKLTFLTTSVLGFTGHSIFQSLTESMTKNAKTKLGINKK